MVHRQLTALRAGTHAVVEVVAWVMRRRQRFCVGGRSMLPTLQPGEFVLVHHHRTPGIGDVVVAEHPDHEMLLVKRVASRDAGGGVFLSSDNGTEGSDSRSFGPVSRAAIKGVVTISLERPMSSLSPRAG